MATPRLTRWLAICPEHIGAKDYRIMATYFVYMLTCRGGTLYTGIARDVAVRFEEHRSGKGARYTAAHRPMRVVYTERKASRSAALKREYEIKSWSRAKKLSLIADVAQR